MKTICVFGDSITWGAWDPLNGGWVARLRKYFDSLDDDIKVYNCGVCGNNTDDLFGRFENEVKARNPSVIIL